MEYEEAQAKIALSLSKGNLEQAINQPFLDQTFFLIEETIQTPSQHNANQDLT